MGVRLPRPRQPPERGEGPIPQPPHRQATGSSIIVAKITPGEFMRQVRAEGSKVVWPSMKETRTTAIMVLIMTALLAIFFFGVDSAFGGLVKWLLSLLG